MESRFAHLRERDNSVSMLRTKIARRRSQSQKENRERTVNSRRQLSDLSNIVEKEPAGSVKAGERLKQLERWKERKALEKDKAKREKERKGVFKTGLYHPTDNLRPVPAASTKAKGKKEDVCQSTRVTRSMKQQFTVKPQQMGPNIGTKKAQSAVEKPSRTQVVSVKPVPVAAKTNTRGAVRALSTRSVNRPPATAALPMKDKPKSKAAGPHKTEAGVRAAFSAASDVRTTRSKAIVCPVAPFTDQEKEIKEAVQPAVLTVQTQVEALVSTQEEVPQEEVPQEEVPQEEVPQEEVPQEEVPQEEVMVVDKASEEPAPPVDPAQPPPSLSSFAPVDFVFQAPVGLSTFKFEPMTPRSTGAFLTPSPNFSFSPFPLVTDVGQAEPDRQSPPKSPRSSPPPPRTPPAVAPPAPCTPLEAKHDVPYFRSEIATETDRLTTLSLHWESKVEDESIPEEMRDRMRTAVGQARLLMKERFKQFSGLVDDCELSRGDKITTCTDLQGFWDMVYYQVEDVNKKFDALKDAEGRGWVEELKPPPRQKKVVKKPSAAPAKPPGGKAAAAKSRLAAVKAAMRAKQQEAEKEAKAAAETEEEPTVNPEEPQPSQGPLMPNQVVFDGGFFRVESPAKASVRRSSRLSAAQPSPCSTYLSPRRVTRQSLALARTPAGTPAQPRLVPQQTPTPAAPPPDNGNSSLCFPPVDKAPSADGQSEGGSAGQGENDAVPELSVPPTIAVVDVEEEAVDISIRHSPRLSTSPRSPSGSPAQPPLDSLPVISSPAVSDQQLTPTPTPEELPGLDFERYLQPSLRGSLSPQSSGFSEMWSPMAEDVEMESPKSEGEDRTAHQTPVTAAPPAASSVLNLQSPQDQTAECAMLLFTPDIKDRIRPSVCPSDLMVFTPPSIDKH